ncbi:VCBS domain-containing protein [Luteibacter anthropi]|uniref:VCBS domain-containing protein n=1 Tax=Luteibacter anthropi TaxID=564369 RepID=UPI0020330434|nr:VCBS domain-containing protein [Luteibacter anthropi]URX61645.1 VCBS domain-containing protein [Luteibacter anthropi]
MTGTKYPHVFRPRSHRYALEPRQMYDGAALTEASTHHADPGESSHDGAAFRSAATEQPGHAVQTAMLAAPRVALAAAGGMDITTSSKGLTVSEPSTLNAAGADRGTLSGWSIDGSGTVTVTAVVSDTSKGLLGTTTAATSVAGGYRFTGSVADATAWLNQLTFTAADVELGNTAARTTIEVSVTDSQSHSANHSLDVTVTPSNDPVSVADATKTVDEVSSTGGPSISVIGTDTLVAIDPEVAAGTQTPEQIVYSVTDLPKYGYLALEGNRLGAGSVFTQQDVIDGKLTYVHTATGADQDTTDGFVARVNDGATPADRSDTVHVTLAIRPMNQAPTIGGTGVVYEGQPANAVDTGNVGKYIVADSGGDPQDTALRVTITGLPQHGTLYFDGMAVVVGQSFDYADRARLTYANDGVDGISQDSFGVRVTDMGGGTGVPASTDGTVHLDVHAVDDDPALDPASTRHATVTAGGDGSAGAYSVVLTPTMIGATDVDSPDQNISFVTGQAGLTHGYLLLNGERLKDGATFTMADVRAGRVQYVQTAGATAGQQDTFHFQVVDNTTALRWNPDGSTFTRIGGDYTGGTPADTLRDYTFTIDLAPTAAGNGGAFPIHDVTTVEHQSTYAGMDPSGNKIGSVLEGGSIVLHGTTTNGQPTDFSTTPGLSYTAQGVDPSQVVYTFLGFTSDGAGTGNAGTLQKQVGSAWVDISAFGTFTQADLDAGRIRFQHDGDSEDFHTTARFSVSAGLVDVVNGQPTVDNWQPSFDIYVTPTNDLPVVTGSSGTVIPEGGTGYITRGQLGISDPDDARSEPWLEGSPTLPNGDPNYAYNNDASGTGALKFMVNNLPAGGTLQYSTDGGHTWQNVTAGTLLDASIITDDSTTTGLRFVSNGSEVRNASFTVTAVDRWGAHSATDGTVSIQITNVNDAPQIAKDPTQANPTVPSDSPNNIGGAPANNPLTVIEGGAGRITDAMLQAYDPDSSARQVQYTITSAPAHGRIAYSTDGVNFQYLGVGSSFTQADVSAGRIYYLNDGTEPAGTAFPNTPDDRFGFTVSDGDKEQAGNQFWIYTSPANDPPTVTAPNGPIDLDSADPRYNPVPGFSVADPDLTTVGPGDVDYLRVTVRLLHSDGTAFSAAEYAAAGGVSIGYGTGGASVDAAHGGSNDYLVLSGTRAQVNAALAGLTVTFGSDRNAIYQVQVIADDRLRDTSGQLTGSANGGAVNQSATPGTGTATTAVDATEYDWYSAGVPVKNGNIGASSVSVRASSVNEPGTIGGPSGSTVYEDQATFIGGSFVVSDPESAAFDTPVTVRLSVPSGVLGIGGNGAQGSATASAAGSRAVTISGDNTGTLVLTGRASDIQALLNDAALGLTYLSAPNVNHDMNGAAPGDVTLTVHFDDTGSAIGSDTGAGSVPNNPADLQIGIDIVAVNDPPTVNAGSGTIYLNGSTPVGGFSVDDVDYTDQGGITTGEHDFMQVTVRISDAAGNALPRSAYGDIVLGSSASGTSGATVDGTSNGNGIALVIRGTRQQVNDYLAGLKVSIGGNLANVDQAYRVDVIADDRLRDVTTGALDGSGAANGGENAATGGGVQAVPVTDVDPYGKVPAGLGQNVALGSRTVFPSSINNPTAIGVTAPNVTDESAAGIYTLSHVTLADPDAGTADITATVTLPSGFGVHDIGGSPDRTGSFGTATYVIGQDAQGRTTVTITGSIDKVQAAINAVGVKLPPSASGDNNAYWNGTFQVMISVNDGGNHGDRPDRGTLDGDAADNAAHDPSTVGDEYGYADGENGSSNALVTTRVFNVTVNSATKVSESGLVDHDGKDGVDGAQAFALFNPVDSVTLGNPADGPGHSVTLTLAQLQDLASVPLADRTMTTAAGTLVVTGYVPGADSAHGTLLYHYTLNGAQSQPGAASSMETVAIAMRDSAGFTDSGRINVTIVNDTPTARPDTGTVNEDGAPLTGNVVTGGPGADRVGADANPNPVTGVVYGTSGGHVSGHVGTGVTGTYGTLTLNADGSYTYVLDNTNPTVNALKDGQSLTEVYTYTITDGDGDRSTTTLTITIAGHTDGAPAIVPHDGNGAADGHTTVWESGLTPDGPSGQLKTATDTVDISAADGLTSITVGGTTLTAGQLAGLSAGTPRQITTSRGTLWLTGFQVTASVGGVPTAGTLSYTYTLGGSINQPGLDHSTDTIALAVNDAGGGTASGSLVVNIVNDVPTARPDTADVNEDGAPVSGNVVTGGAGADRIGADANGSPVVGVAPGNTGVPATGNLGTGVAGSYGTLTLNANGSYTYVVDNTNPAVNALKDGQTLTETYTYTIADGDGDRSTTTLTITIHGHTDGVPSIVPVDGNGAATGHATVIEAGLANHDGTQTTGGSIDLTAADGLAGVTVGGTTLTLAQLDALNNGQAVTIHTPDGTLVLTGFNPTTSVGGVPTAGTLTYTYTLDHSVPRQGGGTDAIDLKVVDAGGGTANGTLVINIVDDTPTARPDTADIDEDGPSIAGNVVTGGPGADRIGADTNPLPVTGVVYGNTGGPVSGHVGTGVTGTYGTLTLNADGSYSYVLDNANPTVNALKDGDTLTEVYTYTIVDGDGDTSTTTLTITIHGHTDGGPSMKPHEGNGTNAAGENTVWESGLTSDGPDHQGRTTTGSIDITAPDGLASISVGGVVLNTAQLAALGNGSPVTVMTPYGTLTLAGFQPTRTVGGITVEGSLNYTYELNGAVTQPGIDRTADAIALTVTDAGGGSSTGQLTINIVNDAPTARPDTADVNEDGAPVSGNVVTGGAGADRIGADANALPVAGVVHGTATSAVSGNVGSGVAGTYGTLTLNADGSYTYAVDNANPTVNALKDGQTLTETYSYTIVDADGDSSTTTLTITIHGHTDGTPSIVPVDGNGAATGHATVIEAGLANHDGTQTTGGSIDLTAADGLAGVTIGGTSLTLAQLDALNNGQPVTIHTPDGTLVLTGFNPTTSVGGVPTAGTLTYTYTLDHSVPRQGGGTDTIALQVIDAGGGTASGALVVNIVDDVPTARPDTATVHEDGAPVTGNVITGGAGADRIGADANPLPVAGVVHGASNGPVSGNVGSGVAGTYGTLTLNADGSYTYALDNANPRVNALKDGDTLTEVYTYTIVDGDGDSSTTTLTITIAGHTDGTPAIVPHDGNGEGNGPLTTGHTTVWESGLTSDGPAGQGKSASDTIVVSAPDGLTSITVGGVTLTADQLTTLGNGKTVTVVTGNGTLVLTGFEPTATVGGVVTQGTLSYTYTLGGAVGQPGTDHSTDTIALSVNDAGGGKATGSLVIDIVNDVPTAHDDAASIDRDAAQGSASGNVFTGGPSHTGADRIGADGPAKGGPVTGVTSDNLGQRGSIGNASPGQYGTLVLNADGSYTYVVDPRNPQVSALDASRTLSEVFVYTITDADGDTSEARLVITIRGATPPIQARWGDQIFPLSHEWPGRDIRQGYDPGLFILPTVDGVQRDTQAWQLGRMTGAIHGLEAGTTDLDPDNVQYVLRDGVAFSRQLLVEVRSQSRVASRDAGLGSRVLWDDFSPFASQRIEQTLRHDQDERGKADRAQPSHTVRLPRADAPPAGAPSLSTRLARLAHGAPAPVAAPKLPHH